jgi:Ser/Thr protein kinase RdoA (MazF antagonist)
MPATDSKRIAYFSDDEAGLLLRDHFGVEGTLTRLPGYIAQNYRVSVPDGAGWVLKILPTDEPQDRIEMRHQALARIADAGLELDTPVAARTLRGDFLAWAPDAAGHSHPLTLLSYLAGDLLSETRPRSPALLESLGVALGRLHSALDGFQHPAAHEDHGEWDLTQAAGYVSAGARFVSDPGRRAMLERIEERFESDVTPFLSELPSGIIHGDANDQNVVVSPRGTDDRRVSGLLDFGDLVYGPLVCDVAIGAAYGCMDTGDFLGACAAVVRGYVAERPLSEVEANALYPLIRGRLATSVVHSEGRSEADRADPYLTSSEAMAWEAIEAFDRLDSRAACAAMREAAGYLGTQ